MNNRKAGYFVFASVLALSLFAYAAYKWDEKATLVGTVDQKFEICWRQNANGAPPIDSVQLRRTRLEGGAVETTRKYARNEWIVKATESCLTENKLPRTGHFVYEIKVCVGTSCGPWQSSADPLVGTVNGNLKPWWIYAYLPAPGAPVPLGTPLIPPRDNQAIMAEIPQPTTGEVYVTNSSK